nr:hypothetical protein CFP56_22014 [Quercus suber]
MLRVCLPVRRRPALFLVHIRAPCGLLVRRREDRSWGGERGCIPALLTLDQGSYGKVSGRGLVGHAYSRLILFGLSLRKRRSQMREVVLCEAEVGCVIYSCYVLWGMDRQVVLRGFTFHPRTVDCYKISPERIGKEASRGMLNRCQQATVLERDVAGDWRS